MVSGSAWFSVTWGRGNFSNLNIQSLLSTSHEVSYCFFKVATTSCTVRFIYSVNNEEMAKQFHQPYTVLRNRMPVRGSGAVCLYL